VATHLWWGGLPCCSWQFQATPPTRTDGASSAPRAFCVYAPASRETMARDVVPSADTASLRHRPCRCRRRASGDGPTYTTITPPDLPCHSDSPTCVAWASRLSHPVSCVGRDRSAAPPSAGQRTLARRCWRARDRRGPRKRRRTTVTDPAARAVHARAVIGQITQIRATFRHLDIPPAGECAPARVLPLPRDLDQEGREPRLVHLKKRSSCWRCWPGCDL
jgi:hypothetical protein